MGIGVLTSGILISDYKLIPRIKNNLKFRSKFGDEYQGYKSSKDGLIVPRNFDIFPYGIRVDDVRSNGIGVDIKSAFKPLFEEQETLVSSSVALLNRDISHILQASTGRGKTVMGTEIALRIGKKFVVIVPKEDILKQWCNAFTLLGIPEDKIGYIQGNRCDTVDKVAVVAMVHSVCKENRYHDWVFKEFGLCIIDEVHTLGADTFSQAMWNIPAKLRLGLTATPYRADGKDNIFELHIGKVKVKSSTLNLTPRILIEESPWKVPLVNKHIGLKTIKVKLEHKAGKTMHINKMIAGNISRNKMIGEFGGAAYKSGRHIIIFSDLKIHLERIEDFLISNKVPRKEIGYYVGGLTEAKREVVKLKKVLLATYKMASMATDIPSLDTCILGTPRSDIKQIVGRILRIFHGKKEPLVFDIQDNDSSVFKAYANKRLRYYKSINATVEVINAG